MQHYLHHLPYGIQQVVRRLVDWPAQEAVLARNASLVKQRSFSKGRFWLRPWAYWSAGLLTLIWLGLTGSVSGQTITTVAGSDLKGDGAPATDANLNSPYGVAVDGAGNLYIADLGNHLIRKVSSSGIITTVAGNGTAGFGGDNGPATSASLNYPTGVAVDGAGNLYIADYENHRIRKVSSSGIITTVAGNGTAGFGGDNGPATSASLLNPYGVAVDGAGNLYIADNGNRRIRKVTPSGTITTVAGNGSNGFSGDGGPATGASLNYPTGVAVDGAGNLYIADQYNRRIRKVTPSGTITTVAGNGSNGYSGDGGPATSASLVYPTGVAVDGSGNLYIADASNRRIRKVTPSGTITTVAGNGSNGYSGDGGPATSASLVYPYGVAVDGSGNLYIADASNSRIRKVSASGTITTVAGNGNYSYSGDGGPATSASLNDPLGVAVDGSGNIYIADPNNQRIRKVSTSGIITTVAGNGTYGFSGDGGPATSASLSSPVAVAVDGSGNLYIADNGSNRIRKMTPDGTITTVAGNGSFGYSGDGGPATSAGLGQPYGVAVDRSGNIYISDSGNNRIRKVTPGGTITTVAGTGTSGYSGDNGPATSASLNYLRGVAVDGSGNLYIADVGNNRIRKVTPSGTITTIAGNGSYSYGGDGGPATSASLAFPAGVAVDGSGNIYIVDEANNRIRKVSPGGIITTIAGNGTQGYSGDGGPATSASLNQPFGVGVDGAGSVYIADQGSNRIRKVTFNTAPTVVTTIPSQTATVGQPFSYTLPANAFTDAETPNSLTYSASIVTANGLVYNAVSRVISGTATVSGVSTVTVTATDPGSLTASQTFTITVNCPALTATIAGNLTVCSGGSTTLTASGGSTYLWSTGATSATISATASPYSVTVSSGSCSASTSTTVTANPALTATIAGNLTVCSGGSTTLTASGGTSYQWNTGATTAMISATAGTYSVTATSAQGCSASTSATVTANPALTATIAGNLTVCAGSATTLTASGGSTYLWSTGATTAIISATAGTYSVTVSSGGCSASTSTTVTANPALTATIAGNLTVCSGGSTTLTASGGSSFLWSTGATTAMISATAGTYSVTATSAQGCSASTSASVTANLALTATIAGNLTVCAGSTTTLTASGGTSYLWNTGATTAMISATAGAYSVTATSAQGCSASTSTSVTELSLPMASLSNNGPLTCAQTSVTLTAGGGGSYSFSPGASQTNNANTATVVSPGPYSVTVTSAQGCSMTATTTVTSNTTAPSVSITPSALTGCAGQSIQLTASGGDTYQWSTGQTSPSISLTATGTQLVSVTATTTSNGCSATTSQSITIQALPTAPSLATAPNQPYPAGVSRLTASQNTGSVILVAGCSAGSLSWDGGSSTSLAVSTAALGEQRFQGVCLQNGCSSPTAQASVTVVATTLSVLHRDADYGSTQNNIIKPFLELANAGSQAIPYGEITVRYWFTSEGNALPTNLAVYYAPLGAVSMNYVALPQPRQGAYGYVEYSFPGGGSLGVGSNSGPIENGIQKSDGSNFNESDDYSYQANYQDYVANAHVTAYRNGVIVWGQEPAAVATQMSLQVYSQAKDGTTTSQIQTRLEVRNTGNVAVAVSSLKLRYYFTSDNGQPANVYVDYADIGSSNVQARVVQVSAVNGADSYVELSFPGNTQLLSGLSSLGAIDFRLVRSDYGLLNQSNDYSFMANYGYVGLNSHVTAYLNNSLVFGTPPSGAPARIIAQEPISLLQAKVLGNPVVGSSAEVEITGVAGQAVSLKLIDLQGRAVHEQRVEQASETERVSLPLGSNRGQLLLKVNTADQQQSLKLLRP